MQKERRASFREGVQIGDEVKTPGDFTGRVTRLGPGQSVVVTTCKGATTFEGKALRKTGGRTRVPSTLRKHIEGSGEKRLKAQKVTTDTNTIIDKMYYGMKAIDNLYGKNCNV
eukprot:TRINITY_DN833_c1_g2_i1.p2 TRINITY_DN833_c1_g2~~TRINITY_DN833_c1_g2_i1.p2  ORF type:complete len:132 (+),score=34.85 TRINITY_DN833_c1_g2_i1:60-398(+)